ncbi:MAG: hypothetical protein P8X43_15640 [Maritimibacter sp.]
MKRIWLVAFMLAAVPTGMLAGNTSIVDQYGNGNSQTTEQSGRGFAITVQRGDGNTAGTVQTGRYNISVIHQNGTNLSRTVVQDGDFNISSSTQLTSRTGAESFHQQIAGSPVIRGTITMEIVPED